MAQGDERCDLREKADFEFWERWRWGGWRIMLMLQHPIGAEFQ